jgi:hypothetical protein
MKFYKKHTTTFSTVLNNKIVKIKPQFDISGIVDSIPDEMLSTKEFIIEEYISGKIKKLYNRRYCDYFVPVIVDDSFWKTITKKHDFHGVYLSLNRLVTIEQFSKIQEKDLIFVCTSNHSFVDIKGGHIPSCIYIDYINGPKQKDWDWENLKKHLQNHEYVVEYECMKIPYYNADILGEEGIQIWFYSPDKNHYIYNTREIFRRYNKIWEQDILGINKFYTPRKS